MRDIALGGRIAAGRVALIDDEDYGLISQYRWYAAEVVRPDGQIDGPYAVTSLYEGGRQVKLRMHALVTGWPRTDHINHDGLDNRRTNLRPATVAQNNHNQRPKAGRSSRYKGVAWHRRARKWQAMIKGRYLGCFTSEEDAAHAYNAAALEAYGSYAYLNSLPGKEYA